MDNVIAGGRSRCMRDTLKCQAGCHPRPRGPRLHTCGSAEAACPRCVVVADRGQLCAPLGPPVGVGGPVAYAEPTCTPPGAFPPKATCPYRARGPSATRAAPPFCRGVKDARLRGRSLHQATEPRERGCCAKTNTFASGGPPSVFPPFSGGHSSYRKRIGLSRSRY